MRLITYEASLTRADNIARAYAIRRQIERLGGHLSIEPIAGSTAMLVILRLPEQYHPADVLPGIPFYAALE